MALTTMAKVIQRFRFFASLQNNRKNHHTGHLHTSHDRCGRTRKSTLYLQNWCFSQVFSVGLSLGWFLIWLPAELLKLFVNRPFTECQNKQYNYTSYGHQHKQAQSPVVAGLRVIVPKIVWEFMFFLPNADFYITFCKSHTPYGPRRYSER